MFHYVTDKEFLKESKRLCADLVNQLTQQMEKSGIEAGMSLVGSAKRGLITQNGKQSIDYDYNLWIWDDGGFKDSELKLQIMGDFNYVLWKNGYANCYCKDSTSVISSKKFKLKSGNKTEFSIDLCIVKEDDNGNWHRLIHDKTGRVQSDRWFWNMAPKSMGIAKKEEYLKANHWQEVKDAYLDIKNMYLTRNDHDHPSFVCYIEAINEVYYRHCGRNNVRGGYSIFDVRGSFVPINMVRF